MSTKPKKKGSGNEMKEGEPTNPPISFRPDEDVEAMLAKAVESGANRTWLLNECVRRAFPLLREETYRRLGGGNPTPSDSIR